MTAKYFDTPFAISGDVSVIPTGVQPDGSVSYTQGFPVKYSTAVASGGLNVPRTPMNELFYEITLAIQQYQQHATPDYYASISSGGGYSIGDRVRYLGAIYKSLVNTNADLPSVAASWQLMTYSVVGQSSSVDGEIALFSGTGGQTIKRATGTGYVKVTSGVMGTPAATIPLTDLATQAANTVVANGTASTAVPTALALANSTVLARSASGNVVGHTLQGLAAASGVLSIASGNNLQAPVTNTTTTFTTCAGNIPYDNTIPQIGEGTQVATVTVVPVASSDIIRIEFQGMYDVASSGQTVTFGVFKDSGADAIFAISETDASNTHPNAIFFAFEIAAGSTASRTYSVRMGAVSGNSFLNGDSGGASLGGVSVSGMKVSDRLA